MHAILTVAGKDLKERIRDRSFFIFGVLAPFSLAFILNLVLGGTLDLNDISYSPTFAIVDEDTGEIGEAFEGIITSLDWGVDRLEARSDAAAAVEDGEVAAAIVVPEGFGGAINAGAAAAVEVIGSPDALISRVVAEAIAGSVAGEVRSVQLSIGALGASGELMDPQTVIVDVTGQPPTLLLTEQAAADRSLDSTSYFAVGLSTLFLFFTVQGGILSVLEERQNGTMARLLVAPMTRMQLLLGKTASSVVTGLVSMAVLVIGTTFLMGADWGNPLGVALLSFAGVLAATGLAILLATIARTAEQAGNFGAILAMVLGMLGGVFFPIGQGPEILAVVSKVSPHAWLLQGFGDNTADAWGGVLLATAAILAFAAITTLIALPRVTRFGARV